MTTSLSAKFVAAITPIFLVVFVVFISAYGWVEYNSKRQEIADRLNVLAASQSIILSEPIANKDTERLSLLLASIISDPSLAGIAVFDETGGIIDSFGTLEASTPDLAKSISVNFADASGFREVGALRLIMTEDHLRNELKEHLVDDSILALALLVTALIGAVFAHRRIVMRPLDSLLTAIVDSQGDTRKRVDWNSNDEIGSLIESYNKMHDHIDAYESELKAIQDQLERRVEQRTRDLVAARESAEEASRVKSKFLSSMSHEFRTPMNAVLGFTQIMQMATELQDNERLLDRLSKIEESAMALMSLLDEIMDFTQLDNAEEDLEIESIDLQRLILDAVSLAAPLAEARKIKIVTGQSASGTGNVMADPDLLRKALFNLLSNAIKYNRPGGSVSIETEQSGDRILVTVSDTGFGIPADQFHNIFEPFNRIGREAGTIEGSGIGLTITQRIIEMMHGEIDLDSTEGEGSIFRLSFPRAA